MTGKFSFLLFAVLLSVIFGCAPRSSPLKVADDESLPTAKEQKQLGYVLSRMLLQDLGGAYPDSAFKEYVNQVGRRLIRDSDNEQLSVSLANDSTPLSFSLPGGFIIITRGLLQILENESQLAALLARQAGYLRAGADAENMRLLVRGRAVFLRDVQPAESGYSQRLVLVRQLTERLQRQDDIKRTPSAADIAAIDLLVHSGYPLTGFFELDEIWPDEHQTVSDAGRTVGSSRLSALRLQTVRDYIATTYPNYRSATDINTTAYLQHMENLQQVAPAYTLYDQARQAEAAEEQTRALQLYHQAIQQAPRSMLLTALGMAYLRGEDLIPARRYLRQAVTADAEYYRSRLGLGYIHLRRLEWAEAVAELEASLSLLPTFQGVFLLAEAEEGRSNSARARRLYQQLIEADSRSVLGQTAADRLRHLPR
ncbi:MAG: hypothetical protein R6V33_06640 [Pelovirga sp.]